MRSVRGGWGAGPDSVQIAGSSRDHREGGSKYREKCNEVETLNTGDTQLSGTLRLPRYMILALLQAVNIEIPYMSRCLVQEYT